MKIRTSFVSNSSSTSFCCFGVVLDRDQQEKCEFMEKDEWDDYYLTGRDRLNLDWSEGLGDIYSEYMSVGLSPNRMKDNETLHQFKERTFVELRKLKLGIKWEDMRWITDGGYHG